jgi:hypothetical protein
MQMMTALRVSLGTLAFLALAGCVSHHPYPESWPATLLPLTQGCGHFEGTYGDRGESPGLRDRPSLTLEIFGTSSGWGRATRVSFSLPKSEVLKVTVWEGTTELFTRTLSSRTGDFTCQAGRLVVHDRRAVGGAGVMGYEMLTLTLNATDEYLLAQRKDSGVSLVLIFPVAGSTTRWYRFPRLHE